MCFYMNPQKLFKISKCVKSLGIHGDPSINRQSGQRDIDLNPLLSVA